MTESRPVRKDCLVDIFRSALEAVDPYRAVARHANEMLVMVMFSMLKNERHFESERGK
jgi:glycerate-2-kinase